MSLANDLLLKALALQPVERTPVWVMRQAGRYLPEYRELRARAGSFMRLCSDPELACAVTLQPIERFGLDAAIIFSDILTIPDALGLGLQFTDGEGPWLERPLRDEGDVAGLGELDIGRLSYVADAVAACKGALAGRVPLIGFAGGPFTLACYMVEGRGGEFLNARRMMHARPELFARVLETNSAAIASLLAAQAGAGADVLMIFESWAGLVPQHRTRQVLLEPLGKALEQLRAQGIDKPVIVFCRGAGDLAGELAKLGFAGLGVDWRTDIGELSSRLRGQVALQGNMDPAVMLAGPEAVRAEVRRIVASYAAPCGHIFNLGHGIHKDTPIASMEALVDEVRQCGSGR